MESMIYEKAQGYLADHVGEMTAAGTPIFDSARRMWRVPVLCKTAKGILPVGEFVLDEAGGFIAIPDKSEMVRVLEAQASRLPFLVFGQKEDLERKGVQVVAV